MFTVKPTLNENSVDNLHGPDKESHSTLPLPPTSPKIWELKSRFEAQHEAITSRNSAFNNPESDEIHDCKNCLINLVTNTDLVECKMDKLKCQWEQYFGNTRFCKHPSAKEFATSMKP